VNIKKLSLAVAGALLVVGCASTPTPKVTAISDPLEARPEITKKEATFFEDFGTLRVEMDEKTGDWIAVEAHGIASINANHRNSEKEAIMLAKMDALNNINEFLNLSSTSTKSVESTTKTLLDDSVNGGTTESKKPTESIDAFGDKSTSDKTETTVQNNENRARVNKVAKTIKETLTQHSVGNIKGGQVIKTKVDRESNLVAVTVRVSKQNIIAARKIRNQMDGV
jgi:hypothetical protein